MDLLVGILTPILMYLSPLIKAAGLASFHFLTANPSPSNSTTGPVLNQEVDLFINGILSEWNSSAGVAVAVVRLSPDGEWNIETKGYGVAKADGTKVTDQTLMAIGSNSKLFDVLATGLLISNESLSPRLDWTTKISSIIPEWKLMDPIASKGANIIDAMSHRTGLPRHDNMYGPNDTVPDIIRRLQYLKPSAEFRDVWQYSNAMYTALSYLPTLLLPTKPSFARYVKENILDRLGMNATTYSFVRANKTGYLADGFARQGVKMREDTFGRGIARVLPYWSQNSDDDGNTISGAGGIISNAVDMATWLQTLLLGGRNPKTNETVIPSDVINKVATGITVQAGNPQFPQLSAVVYGGGQSQNSYRGHVLVEHGGDVPGFHSQITRFPFDGLGVAVLTNDDTFGPYFREVIKYRIIDEAFGLTPQDVDTLMKSFVVESVLSTPLPTPRPTNASLPNPGFTGLSGVYENPGYGSIELCFTVPNVSSSSSNSCKELLSQVDRIIPGTIDSSTPTFLAKFDKMWLTHLRFTHYDGNVFNLTGLTSQPTFNQSSPFWTMGLDQPDPGLNAEFAVDGNCLGFGITGGFWGAGGGVPDPSGKTVKERAEVWYSKVE